MIRRGTDEDWPVVAPMLQMAVDMSNGTYWLEDIKRFIDDGAMFLIVAEVDGEVVAAMVAEHVQYPRKSSLKLVFAGGSEMEKWADDLNAFMEVGARNVGAELIEVHGRPGWARFLKSMFGATSKTTIVAREVAL